MPNYKSSNPTNEYVVQTKQVRDEMLQEGILSVGDKVYVIADKKRYIVDFSNNFQEYSTGSGSEIPEIQIETVESWARTKITIKSNENILDTKTIPSGGVWCDLINDNGTYYFSPFEGSRGGNRG